VRCSTGEVTLEIKSFGKGRSMLEYVFYAFVVLLFILGLYDRYRAYHDARLARERGEPTPGELAAKKRAEARYQLWILFIPLYNRKTGRIGRWTWVYFGVVAALVILAKPLGLSEPVCIGILLAALLLPLLNEIVP